MNNILLIKKYNALLLIVLLLLSMPGQSQDNISYDMGEYTVYYNVFNSSVIPADVANAYQLTRAKNRVYLNVAVVKKSGGYGVPPQSLSGYHRNLMQQKFPLTFTEIKEATATYYLAPIRFNNEDILHIDITVQADSNHPQETFTITKKLYVD